MKKAISIGIQGFSDLREQDCFFVDKTNFIKEWWENRDVVTLITRPRRFGKTLNMSMLECFFSKNMPTEQICLKDFLSGRTRHIGNCRERIL